MYVLDWNAWLFSKPDCVLESNVFMVLSGHWSSSVWVILLPGNLSIIMKKRKILNTNLNWQKKLNIKSYVIFQVKQQI